MEKNYIIYCHVNKLNGKRYIGQTKQSPQKRWGKNGSEYIRKSNDHFKNAILKYGWDNFDHQILFTELTKKEADEKEIELISLYQTTNPKYGYNLSEGGNSNTLSEEQKKNRSELNYKMWQDGTFKKIINTPVYCIELDLAFESALSASRATGIDNSAIQKACKNKVHYAGFMPNGQPIHWIYLQNKNDDIIQQLKNKKEIIKGVSVPVYCKELNELFESAKQAEEIYHIHASNIRNCINGHQKTAGKHPQTNELLHWIERSDLIQAKGKLTEEIVKELLQ